MRCGVKEPMSRRVWKTRLTAPSKAAMAKGQRMGLRRPSGTSMPGQRLAVPKNTRMATTTQRSQQNQTRLPSSMGSGRERPAPSPGCSGGGGAGASAAGNSKTASRFGSFRWHQK